ncbi:MAG: AAA family ATPase [Christensenella sp.]
MIAIANQKGGVGKTTTAINLSACIAAQGKRVLLIDIDPQGNSSSGLGVERVGLTKSSYDVLVSRVSAVEAIRPTMMKTLDIMPANIDLVGAEVELVPMMARETILKQALADIKELYDYIFMDCPPSLGLITLNALTAADKILVPIQCEYYALEGLTQLMSTVKLVRQSLNPALEVEGVVLTMYDGRTNLSLQVVAEVRKFFKNKVYQTVIPRNVRLGEAPSYGLPIILYDERCLGTEAYNELASEFLKNDVK